MRQRRKKGKKMCQEEGQISIELRREMEKNKTLEAENLRLYEENEKLKNENAELKERLGATTKNFRKTAPRLREHRTP